MKLIAGGSLLAISLVSFSSAAPKVFTVRQAVESDSIPKDSASEAEPSFSISLPDHAFPLHARSDTIELLLNARGTPVAGFSLKLCIPAEGLRIEKILPGSFIDSCEWELFDTREHADSHSGLFDCGRVWQIVGLARYVNIDTTDSGCLSLTGQTALARLVLSIDADALEYAAIPIYFYWQDCRDNTLSGETGVEVYISRQVEDPSARDFSVSPNQFPTTIGTPRQCVNPASASRPQRKINFRHGIIRMAPDTLSDQRPDTLAPPKEEH